MRLVGWRIRDDAYEERAKSKDGQRSEAVAA